MERERLETCQIEWSPSGTLFGNPKGPYQFWARAISPIEGEYSAGESAKFDFRFTKTEAFVVANRWAAPDYRPKGDDEATTRAHRELVQKLVAEGWQPSTERGNDWWQPRFWRKVDDQIVLPEDLTLYRDRAASEAIQTLPRGTAATALQGDSQAGWVRVRTADGVEGFLIVKPDAANRGADISQNSAQAAGAGCLAVLLLVPGIVALCVLGLLILAR